jgi:hypothetical protein
MADRAEAMADIPREVARTAARAAVDLMAVALMAAVVLTAARATAAEVTVVEVTAEDTGGRDAPQPPQLRFSLAQPLLP